MSHYDWLEKHLKVVYEAAKIGYKYSPGAIGSHGDKCYGYRDTWEEAGVPFAHGVALYLLTYHAPFSNTVRETKDGWVDPCEWVINQYPNFKDSMPAL